MNKQISKPLLQMSTHVYSVPGQTEGKRKASFEWKRTDLGSVH